MKLKVVYLYSCSRDLGHGLGIEAVVFNVNWFTDYSQVHIIAICKKTSLAAYFSWN